MGGFVWGRFCLVFSDFFVSVSGAFFSFIDEISNISCDCRKFKFDFFISVLSCTDALKLCFSCFIDSTFSEFFDTFELDKFSKSFKLNLSITTSFSIEALSLLSLLICIKSSPFSFNSFTGADALAKTPMPCTSSSLVGFRKVLLLLVNSES